MVGVFLSFYNIFGMGIVFWCLSDRKTFWLRNLGVHMKLVEIFIVAIIVIASLSYIVFKIYKILKSKSGENCGRV